MAAGTGRFLRLKIPASNDIGDYFFAETFARFTIE
jgi:hypothetical protein